MKNKQVKIAIHHRKGSFSDRWIEYCIQNNIPFKLVNCFSSDIVEQVKDCDALMWHYHHAHSKDMIAAKKILYSLEQSGMRVFPNFKSNWHFDDKVGQKYLLEAVNAPLVKSYVFYNKKEALEWAKNANFPKVFKLKGGAGSTNVKLVFNVNQCGRLIKKSFGKGFPTVNKIQNLKERVRLYRNGKTNIAGLIRAVGKLFFTPEYQKHFANESGYVYFQDFIPNNFFDIRVIVVGDKAFGLKRFVREGDFRASGSGYISYDKKEIDLRCVEIAFKTNDKLKSQSIAYDFVFDEENNPLIVEISYGFAMVAYDKCEGYWDNNLEWHKESFKPQYWMIENLITETSTK